MIDNDISRVAYNGPGDTFTVPFYFLENSHLKVIKTSGSTDTVLTLTTHYTVSGAGDEEGGEVTLLTPLVSGETVTILRNVPITQDVDYPANDRFPSQSHERVVDKLTMIVQQQQDALNRSMKLSETASIGGEIPASGTPAQRAGRFIQFDENGDPALVLLTEFDAYTITAFAESLLADGNASEARSTLEVYSTDEVDGIVLLVSGALTDHINDTTGAHAASAISFTSGAGLSGTDVAAALDELANEKANDSAVVKLAVEDQAFSGGVVVTSKNLGNITSGTVTPDPGDRPMQHYTNNGAHTLAPSTNAGSLLLDVTNGSTAGAITTSGFTKVTGDAFTTTNGHKFRCHISIGNGGSLLSVQALQ